MVSSSIGNVQSSEIVTERIAGIYTIPSEPNPKIQRWCLPDALGKQSSSSTKKTVPDEKFFISRDKKIGLAYRADRLTVKGYDRQKIYVRKNFSISMYWFLVTSVIVYRAILRLSSSGA